LRAGIFGTRDRRLLVQRRSTDQQERIEGGSRSSRTSGDHRRETGQRRSVARRARYHVAGGEAVVATARCRRITASQQLARVTPKERRRYNCFGEFATPP